MPKPIPVSEEQRVGGGGGKAPEAPEPAILPGPPRPDWGPPAYADPESLKRAGIHKPGRRPRPPPDDP